MFVKMPLGIPLPEDEKAPRDGYFVVGEIVLQVQYDLGVLEPPGKDYWQTWVSLLRRQDSNLGDYTWKVACSFNFTNADYGSSHIHVQLQELLQAKTDDEPELARKDAKLIELVNRLNQPRDPIAINNTKITLAAAVPNWCLTGCGHSPTDPGPGAFPMPVDPADVDTKPHRHKFDTNRMNNLTSHNGMQQTVNVVIFDTAPPRKVLDAAYAARPNNELLKEMSKREKTGNFIIRYAEKNDLDITLPDNLSQEPSGELHGYSHHLLYDMSDHGLFIAGVISDHTPAAKVKIYLVQTQNDYGAGTITSLADGIDKLINKQIIPEAEMDYPLIVNLSLCVGFQSLSELEELGLKLSEAGNSDAANCIHKEVRSLSDPLLALQKRFSTGGIQIIAAAGNDALPEQVPPPARYPAAFDFVLGVGAIEKGSGKRAFYSNSADVPPRQGLMVFGGNAHRQNQDNITDPGNGMLGLFVGSFPDGTPSVNGWAWWAGTSFATAVMTGLYARAATKGRDMRPGIPVDYHGYLDSKKDGDTDNGEPFIVTDQN